MKQNNQVIIMKKVFLYLYPIEEYAKMFLLPEDKLYDEWDVKRPFPILNECIQKRYRDNGQQVVFALYPDKEIFGIIPKKEDKIIYTDSLFRENCDIDENGNEKKDLVPKYPNEQLLIEQLRDVEQLVIGGYHFLDCVKRVGETSLNMGIDTTIDLDLTDLFFNLYKEEDYFNIKEYNPEKFKRQIMKYDLVIYGEEVALEQFNFVYSRPVYGFSNEEIKHKKNVY